MDHARRLRESFGASEDDLALHRSGRLSTEQARKVRGATGDDAVFMSGTAVVLAVVMYGVLYMILSSGKLFRPDRPIGPAHLVILLVSGGLPTVSLLWAAYTVFVHVRGNRAPRVESVEGPIRKSTLARRQLVLHEIHVAERRFGVTERAFDAFEDGRAYRVHYVPIVDVVVSAEPIDGQGATASSDAT